MAVCNSAVGNTKNRSDGQALDHSVPNKDGKRVAVSAAGTSDLCSGAS